MTASCRHFTFLLRPSCAKQPQPSFRPPSVAASVGRTRFSPPYGKPQHTYGVPQAGTPYELDVVGGLVLGGFAIQLAAYRFWVKVNA